jgi:N-acyl-D-aspartate/D-glutamate deacylase
MRSLVRAGMEEGAFGLSSGLFYTPGGFARIDEVVALGHVVAEFNGAYQSHIRDESTYSIGLLAAVDEVITVAEEAGIRGVVTHIKALGPEAWGMARDVITLIEEARARGVEVFADHYPYPAGSTGLRSALVPKWAQEGGEDALRERLRDPEISPRVRAGMTENLARRGGAARIQFREVESAKSLEGGLLSEFATARGIDPVSAAIELLLEGSPSIVSHSMREDDVRAFMALPWTMTASDGGLDTEADGVPHPRSYGAFTRKLAVYARDEGVVDLASAVRSMTFGPGRWLT